MLEIIFSPEAKDFLTTTLFCFVFVCIALEFIVEMFYRVVDTFKSYIKQRQTLDEQKTDLPFFESEETSVSASVTEGKR